MDLQNEVKDIQIIQKESTSTFALHTTTYQEKTFTIDCGSHDDMLGWLVLICGLQSRELSKSLLPTKDRSDYLKKTYFSNFKGGTITSNKEEIWTYIPSGQILKGAELVETNAIFQWDGEVFNPTKEPKTQGCAYWDGINLIWKNANDETVFHYLFETGQYCRMASADSRFDWKWSRHFLVSKGNEGHYSLEGNIPQPVVMCIQLSKYVDQLSL